MTSSAMKTKDIVRTPKGLGTLLGFEYLADFGHYIVAHTDNGHEDTRIAVSIKGETVFFDRNEVAVLEDE